MNTIQNLGLTNTFMLQGGGKLQGAADGGSFKDFLLQSLNDVNAMQQAADHAVEQLATGGDVNPAEVLTAVQKADLAFKLMMQIRNKLVAAYQDIENVKV